MRKVKMVKTSTKIVKKNAAELDQVNHPILRNPYIQSPLNSTCARVHSTPEMLGMVIPDPINLLGRWVYRPTKKHSGIN